MFILFKTKLSYEFGSKKGVVRPILTVLNKTIAKLNSLKGVESTIPYNLCLKFYSSSYTMYDDF